MYNVQEFRNLCAQATEAGREAVQVARIVPMVVGTAKSFMSNEIDYSQPTEYVADGVCGFAWVCVTPANKGNTRLGKEERAVLEANGFQKDVYGKTYTRSVSDYNQSMQKKEAHAAAFAKVLRDAGYNAYSRSRID